MARLSSLLPDLAGLGPEHRLPLAEMALASLDRFDTARLRALAETLDALVLADGRIQLFEYLLQRLLLRRLERTLAQPLSRSIRHYSLAEVRPQCEVLLSTLAHIGEADPDRAARAFAAGAGRLGISAGGLRFLPKTACTLKAVGRALDELARSGMAHKRGVLAACAACVAADRRVKVQEAELLRLVASDLDLPMPPLLPGETLG